MARRHRPECRFGAAAVGLAVLVALLGADCAAAQGQVGSRFGGSGLASWLWNIFLIIAGPVFFCAGAFAFLASFRRNASLDSRRRRGGALFTMIFCGLITLFVFIDPELLGRMLR